MDAFRPELIALAFVLFWAGAMNLMARVGGWASLAEVYRAPDTFDGTRWPFQSAQMRGRVNYGNILTVGANARGLYLVPFFAFRIAHPPLFVPWSDISVTRRKGLFSSVVELGFRRGPGVPFRISERLAQRLAAAAGGAWPGRG